MAFHNNRDENAAWEIQKRVSDEKWWHKNATNLFLIIGLSLFVSMLVLVMVRS
jgi:hypothetical protein